MKNAITTLRIQNFKSIKDVEIKPRRVNLILGEPNVGKSNVLEAISLLGGIVYDNKKFMGNIIRYEKSRQLFYDNLPYNPISVQTQNDTALVVQDVNDNTMFNYFLLPSKDFTDIIGSELFFKYGAYWSEPTEVRVIKFFPKWREEQIKNNIRENPPYNSVEFLENGKLDDLKKYSSHGAGGYGLLRSIRYYLFDKNIIYNTIGVKYLRPPYGDNLIDVIQIYSNLRKEIANFFHQYGLKLMLRVDEERIELVKDLDGVIYSYPYSSTAETLQRLIFYLAAIESNDDAVLLFEEPEAHSFPTYVSQLGRRIVDSENNQFFVVTHSPYLVTEILEEMVPNDELLPQLAIFIAYYEDYQTKIRQLTDDEVRTVRANGTEMFYNIRQFTPAGQE